MQPKTRKSARWKRGGTGAFSHAPAVPGSEGLWRQFNLNLRDARQEQLLRSREALGGRFTYYSGETPSNTPTAAGSGLHPREIASIFTEVITTGRMTRKADMDTQVMRRDTHLHGVDNALRSNITGKPVFCTPNGPSHLQRDLALLGQALIDDTDNFDSSCTKLLKSIPSGYGAGESIFGYKALTIAGRALSIPGWWPQQIDEVYNRNFRFDPIRDDPELVCSGGKTVAIHQAPWKIIFHTGTDDNEVRLGGHLTRTVWPHMIKHDGLARLAQCLNFYGIPHPYAEIPWDLWENDELKEATREAMADFGDGNPYVKVKEVLWGFTQLPQGLDARGMHGLLWGLCCTEQSKAVQGETLTTEMGGVGAYNASQTHEAVKGDIASLIERGLAATIRKWLRAVFQLNMATLCAAFGATPAQILGSVPKVYWLIHRAIDPETRQRMRLAAVAAGLPVDMEQEYRENGWLKPTHPGHAIPGGQVIVPDGAVSVGGLQAAEGVDNPKDEEPASEDDSPARFAAQMTQLGMERCEHDMPNRCRICGIERERSIVPGADGAPHTFKVAWRAIGPVRAAAAQSPGSAGPISQRGAVAALSALAALAPKAQREVAR